MSTEFCASFQSRRVSFQESVVIKQKRSITQKSSSMTCKGKPTLCLLTVLRNRLKSYPISNDRQPTSYLSAKVVPKKSMCSHFVAYLANLWSDVDICNSNFVLTLNQSFGLCDMRFKYRKILLGQRRGNGAWDAPREMNKRLRRTMHMGRAKRSQAADHITKIQTAIGTPKRICTSADAQQVRFSDTGPLCSRLNSSHVRVACLLRGHEAYLLAISALQSLNVGYRPTKIEVYRLRLNFRRQYRATAK